MLFGYPIKATHENWLHECLTTCIEGSIRMMDAGGARIGWPECLPPSCRDKLVGHYGLRDKLAAFLDAAAALSATERATILDAVVSQNNLPTVYDGQALVVAVDELPPSIRPHTIALARHAFSLLTTFGQRDRQYIEIYESLDSRICPFCGCEYFEAPTAPRHDLDHYLPVTHYPFAGANLRNLVPAGDRCNSSYKKDIDILVSNDGTRRRCFDPYGTQFASVSLMGSDPFSARRLPRWKVDLGDTPEAATWDAVWSIRKRYQDSILDAEYYGWLEHFAQWCRRSNRTPTARDEVIASLTEYVASVIQEGFADRAFLKRAVFEMLLSKARQGSFAERLTSFLVDLVSAGRGAAA